MKPTNPAAEIHPAQTAPSEPRQTIAIAICGAIGGASVFEVITSAWLHPATTTQPTAEPVALAGALIGIAATLLVRRYMQRLGEQSAPAQLDSIEASFLSQTAPLSPMTWQPVPHTPIYPPAPSEPLAPPHHEALPTGSCPHTRGRLGRRTVRPIFHQSPAPHRLPAQS